MDMNSPTDFLNESFHDHKNIVNKFDNKSFNIISSPDLNSENKYKMQDNNELNKLNEEIN